MKKLFTNIIACLLLLVSLQSFAETNTNQTTVKRDVATFNTLTLSGKFIIKATVGQAQSVSLVGNEKELSDVKTEVQNNELFISNDKKSSQPNEPTTIILTVPKLQTLTTSGYSEITINHLEGQSFALNASGDQKLILSGTIDMFTLHINGKNFIDAKNLIAKKVLLDGNGSAEASLNATQELHSKTSGNIAVKIYGNPKVVTTSMFGSSTLKVGD